MFVPTIEKWIPVALELPTAEHNLLVDAYNTWKDQGTEQSRNALLSRIAAVSDAGWTQSVISRALGLSRERIRQFVVEISENPMGLPNYRGSITSPPVADPRRSSPGHASVAPEVIDRYAKQLLALQPLATQARGHHGPGSPEREASDQYSLLLKAAAEEHVPITVLAELVGRSPAGLRTRIRTSSRIGRLGSPGTRHKNGVRDPKVVERYAKQLRPLLDDISGGGVNVDRKKSARATELLRKAIDPPNNVSIRALAAACGRSYHSIWVRYLADTPDSRAS